MTVNVLLISEHDDPEQWRAALHGYLPGLNLCHWPDCSDHDSIEFALAWKPPPGLLSRFKNLRLIQCLGMGVDALFSDPALPRDVPIARLYDPDLVQQMSEYVVWAVLNHQRKFDRYRALQDSCEWQQLSATDCAACRVGILGLGTIGQDCAAKLSTMGFPVAGWSRSPKNLPGIESYSGPDGLQQIAAASEVLICLLPLTPQTENIVDAQLIAQMPRGALLINVARGGHVVELDLLAALNSGHLGGAVLDVFDKEPLRKHHPFWDHPKVRVTPHIAGLTRPETAAAIVAANINAVLAGDPPENLVQVERGY